MAAEAIRVGRCAGWKGSVARARRGRSGPEPSLWQHRWARPRAGPGSLSFVSPVLRAHSRCRGDGAIDGDIPAPTRAAGRELDVTLAPEQKRTRHHRKLS